MVQRLSISEAHNTIIWGIGLNVSYTSESLGGATPYTVIRSNVYDTALTAEQVAAEYYNYVDALTGKTTPEEPTD